jgi:hypothetical protein
MFGVMLNKKDVESVRDYMENKGLVSHMNNAGLTYGAMVLILEAIRKECDRIEEELEEN